MINYLAKKMIHNYNELEDPAVRKAYGNLTSTVGIANNVILFLFKFLAGTLARSVSITADAVNNLSDAGSSVISLLSFKLSSKPADEKHPFGHARYECIASMIVAVAILLLGFELIRTSFHKILQPEAVSFSWLSVIILLFSISVKLWMYSYNKKYGRLLKSSIMEATAADSISDVMATGAVLVSTVLSPIIHFNLDGYMGVVVAIFILMAGGGIIKSALDELLGQAPDEDLVKQIQDKINSYDGVLGMHDLMIHERDFQENMGLEMVIHMDPINIDDPLTNELRTLTAAIVKEIDEDLSMHDFRIVPGETHTNMIFDVVVPFHIKMSNQQILDALAQRIRERKGDHYYLVVTFDRAYTTHHSQESA